MDKTVQKPTKSKDNYRIMVENAIEAIFIIQNFTFKFANPMAEKISGYSAKELRKIQFIDIIHPEDRKLVIARHLKRLRGKQFTGTYQFRIITKTGSVLWVILNEVKINWEQKPATLNYLTDITHIKYLEEQLLQSQKMEAIGTLSSGIAHDFNNILFPIIGYAEITQNDFATDEIIQDNMQQIIKAANRAKNLIQQILSFSKTDHTLHRPVDLKPIIKEVLQVIRATIPATIKIETHLADNCGLILGDQIQIHQLVINLCTNAFQSMEKQGGILTVSMQKIDIQPNTALMIISPQNAGPYIQLSITDTGHGMDQKIKQKIFDPYFTTKKKNKGAGIGLSVAHNIINNHQGFITVESEPGQGSTFNVFFPENDQSRPAALPLDEQAPALTGTERVLLIDDEKQIVEMEKHMLEHFGYKVICYMDSIKALEDFKQHPDHYDLVITDQIMPNMTGSELAQKMIKIRPDIPVILCTGFSNVINREKALSLGIKEFLLKPFAIKKMAGIIRKVLDQ